MAKLITHILMPVGGGEHAFCGFAFDAFASGDAEEDGIFEHGRPGLRVTCPECAEAVSEIRKSIRGVRFSPASGASS